MGYRVCFEGHDTEAVVEHGESVLEAAVRAGLAVDYGCSGGNCGLCIARLMDGEVRQVSDWDYVFERGQRDGRHFLMCSHTAAADLRLEANIAGAAGQIPVQRFRAKVRRVDEASPQIAVLRLRVSRSHRLRFLAGQEASLSHPRCGDARLPIASCPCDAGELEFHLRARGGVRDDAFAACVAQQCQSGEWFDVEAPHGSFVFTGNMERPVVLLAWDTHFAFARSLLEHIVAQESDLPIHLYRSGADEPPYYLDNLCCAWHDALDQLEYTALPPSADGDDDAADSWAERIAADHADLAESDYYLCLPPPQAQRAAQALERRGARPGRIFRAES